VALCFSLRIEGFKAMKEDSLSRGSSKHLAAVEETPSLHSADP
jgi:hypothetical protein